MTTKKWVGEERKEGNTIRIEIWNFLKLTLVVFFLNMWYREDIGIVCTEESDSSMESSVLDLDANILRWWKQNPNAASSLCVCVLGLIMNLKVTKSVLSRWYQEARLLQLIKLIKEQSIVYNKHFASFWTRDCPHPLYLSLACIHRFRLVYWAKQYPE